MSAETDTQATETAASLGITIESIERKLTEKLEAQYVNVEDMSGTAAWLSLDLAPDLLT